MSKQIEDIGRRYEAQFHSTAGLKEEWASFFLDPDGDNLPQKPLGRWRTALLRIRLAYWAAMDELFPRGW